MRFMKCLSIRQPWPSLIIHGLAGRFKDVENRSWSLNYRGEILIHASKKIDREACHDFGVTPENFNMPTGVIIGKVEMWNCTTTQTSTWHETGKYGFYLKDPVPIDPVPYPGQLNLFEVDMDNLVEGKKAWMWDAEFVMHETGRQQRIG